MSFDTAAGAILSMSAVLPATYDAAGYGALTKVPIGEITNIGEFGKEFALVTHQPLASRGTKKAKGSFNNGTLSPTCALDNANAGQQAIDAAVESDDPVAVCITLDDGTEYWCAALVMAKKISVGGSDDVVSASISMEIDHNPIVPI